jgi:hypothetical protein
LCVFGGQPQVKPLRCPAIIAESRRRANTLNKLTCRDRTQMSK